ncbi:tripartite tricarboxylate transporter TctB family protein [Sutcliffiella deserti]|uniref:tripartite tricarboxylate transporter TctB family protein n=1 Tax=Sutcliffiella deserti TaxID=2875501 RepID=UPI001CBEE8B5|nr:tripartite tricarboxylate transporter TctB family protein [Sutcliffiella deserti]
MKKSLIIQAVFLLCGLLFVVTANTISTRGFGGDVLNQRNYVIILAWLLIIFSFISIVAEVLKSRKGKQPAEVSEAEAKMAELEAESGTTIEKKSSSKVYLSMVLVFLFVLGFSYIGYYVTSFVFVFLITWLMFDWDKKKWIKSLIFSIGLNVALYVLFTLINVYFPKTLLF